MATIADSLKKSTINIQNISKSLSDTKGNLSSVNQSVNNITKIIATNTRIKSELFTRSQLLNTRRREASLRQEKEDEVQAGKVSTSMTKGFAFSLSSDKGPLGRLLGFLGFVTAGWIVENLPTWIFMGKEFISRVQTFGRAMYNMVDDMQMIIKLFGNTLKNSLNAIIKLDFDEFTEGSVKNSFDELNLAVQGLGDDISDTFKLFTTSLNESLETGEKGPEIGEQREDTMFNEPSPSEGVPSRVTGTAKKALDIISKYESAGAGYNAMNQGTIPDAKGQNPKATIGGKTSKDIIGKNLTDMTIGEVIRRQDRRLTNDQGFIHAAGRYQIIGNTLPEAMRGAGLKPTDRFSPENQDKMGIYLLKTGGPGKWTGLKNASPAEMAIVQQAKRETVTYSSSTKPTPQTFLPNSKLDLKKLGFSIGDRAGYSASRGRIHAGRDIAIAGGTPVSVITDATITSVGNDSGGYGYYVSYIDSNGIEHFYGHLREMPKVKKGQKLAAGTIVGYVGSTGRSTGPHLHWEVSPRIGEVGMPRKSVIDPIEYGFSATAPFVGTKAQISSQPRSQQPSAITPDRKGPQIMFIDDTQPQVPQISYPSIEQPLITGTISEFKLLNNFIKNKLLSDLAYL